MIISNNFSSSNIQLRDNYINNNLIEREDHYIHMSMVNEYLKTNMMEIVQSNSLNINYVEQFDDLALKFSENYIANLPNHLKMSFSSEWLNQNLISNFLAWLREQSF